MSLKSAWNLTTPSGVTIVLSPDEYRLALLGLVDFEGGWAIMQMAAEMVVDGEAKAALIRERLVPVADALPGLLAEGVDVFQLWAARHWFDSQTCRTAASAQRPGGPTPVDARDAGAQQEDA